MVSTGEVEIGMSEYRIVVEIGVSGFGMAKLGERGGRGGMRKRYWGGCRNILGGSGGGAKDCTEVES